MAMSSVTLAPAQRAPWLLPRATLLRDLPLLPALLIFALVFIYPLVQFIGAGIASGWRSAPTLGDLISGRSMLGSLAWNSILLGFWTTLACLIIGYPIAYYLARTTSRLRHYVFVAIFAPLLVSIVVRTFGWIVLLGSNGILNDVLLRLGVIGAPVVWLYNFPATVVGLVHVFLPFMVLSIVSSLARIDQRLEEAATMLGAHPWRVFYYVTLPLSAHGIFGGCTIVFSLAVGAYVTPRLLGGGRVQVLSTEIYTQMLEVGDWGLAALLGAVLAFVTLLAITAYRLSFRRLATRV
jgi:putative spermidine/putrescine transport system permease protein